MRFFVARFEFADGDWSYPWTVWADTYGAAASRLTSVEPFAACKEMQIKERPSGDAKAFGHVQGPVALEHQSMVWGP